MRMVGLEDGDGMGDQRMTRNLTRKEGKREREGEVKGKKGQENEYKKK